MRGYSIPEAEKQALAGAWAVADYRVEIPGAPQQVRVGARAAELERLLPGRSYCFITAFNPPPGLAGGRANHAANARLAHLIATQRWPATAAEASDDSGQWREPGWLLRDISVRQAETLGRRFGQGGVLFWRRGEPVGLRLLWSRTPASFPR